MRRYYAQRVWDDSMGVWSRATRSGDRLIARGMSVATAERVARLLNKDDRPVGDTEHEPVRLIREAIEQLSPPAYFGPASWWERAHDWLEAVDRNRPQSR